MSVISNILYWISTGLLVPVIVLLIFFFIRAIFMVGAFLGQYIQVKKTTVRFREDVKNLSPDTLGAFRESLSGKPDSPLSVFVCRIMDNSENGAMIDMLLSEYEIFEDKNISASRVLTKLGPILGLMGTLIPMGPALVGLSTGDIASMAYNMQVAFATTVVGLVISAVGFLTQMAKERWAVANIAVLEYIAEIVKQSNNTKS